MFGKILKTPEASLAFRMMKSVAPKQSAAPATQQKKKKKPAAGRGGVRARRGGAGKRSLLDVT